MNKIKLSYKEKVASHLRLKHWLIIEAFFIVIASVMIYEGIDFIYNYIYLHNYDYSAITGIGMILPMSVILFLITGAFSHALYKYFHKLNDAFEQVSSGDFSVYLDEKTGGPLSDTYHYFNTMTRELNSIDKTRNDFLNEFSHEFKTPLASINGFSNLLLDVNCSYEDQQKYLKIIASESERLANLTQSQLLLSKLDAQNIIIQKNAFSLDEQIRQCVIMMSSEWSKKSIKFSIELEKIEYYGCADLFQHIWINIIGNAIKYTPNNGEISISSSHDLEYVCITISDTGLGMSSEELAHIWDKYYRVENKTDIKGLGLGLPVVKRILELAHGTIDVSSQPGIGSVFSVELPIEKPLTAFTHASSSRL